MPVTVAVRPGGLIPSASALLNVFEPVGASERARRFGALAHRRTQLVNSSAYRCR
jgi:hypothetical protein